MICCEVRGKRLRVTFWPHFQPVKKKLAEIDKPFADETWGKTVEIEAIDDKEDDCWR